jgi:hypothetical protein
MRVPAYIRHDGVHIGEKRPCASLCRSVCQDDNATPPPPSPCQCCRIRLGLSSIWDKMRACAQNVSSAGAGQERGGALQQFHAAGSFFHVLPKGKRNRKKKFIGKKCTT